MSTPNNTDLLLVERGGSQYKVPYSDLNNKLDTDVFLVERGGVQYKVLGEFIGGSSVGVVTAAPVLTATDSKSPAVITVTNATVDNATLTGNIWLKDGVAIAAATGPSYSAAEDGVYTIKQTWTDDLGNTFQVEAQLELLNPARYVDDAFSTTLWTGDGVDNRAIPTGVDNTEKSLMWVKVRDTDYAHLLTSPSFGPGSHFVLSHEFGAVPMQGHPGAVKSFNHDGINVGTYGYVNNTDRKYVGWNFKATPGFFDVQTWMGDGVAGRQISHDLGSVPGMIFVKAIDDNAGWYVYHRSLGNTGMMRLHVTNASTSSYGQWNQTDPTASVFSLAGQGYNVNESNVNYIAYIFAHDDQSFGPNGDEAIIKCGSYTGNAGTKEVDLGFEPQWLMIKNSTSSSDSYGNADWFIVDMMREQSTINARALTANTGYEEYNGGRVVPRSTGFTIVGESNIDYNASGDTYVYMAIRRPQKPPTVGTEVFAIDTFTGSTPNYISNFPVDFVINREGMSNAGNDQYVGSRLQGRAFLKSNTSDQQLNATAATFDYNNGWSSDSGSASSDKYAWMFKRAPGFMDVVSYTGNSSDNHQVGHNLGVVPEFALFKELNTTDAWVQFNDMNASTYTYGFFTSGDSGTQSYGSGYRMFAQPNATTLFLSDYASMNQSSQDYIVYLFATLDGISKVGSYNGTGNEIDVDCGFTTGARFVMIKRTNGSGDWYIWDTARGINGANEPYIRLNQPDAEVTGTDYIDPLISGFKVTSSAPDSINAVGGEYLFLAIA